MASWQANWALEIRSKWVELLRSGQKTIEVRQYELPPHLLGQPILVVCPPDAPPDSDTQATGAAWPTSGLPDVVSAGLPGAVAVGYVTFKNVKQYRDVDSFERDRDKHCVPADSPFTFQPGSALPLFGWEVDACSWLPQPLPVPAMKRQFRSLLQLCDCSATA